MTILLAPWSIKDLTTVLADDPAPRTIQLLPWIDIPFLFNNISKPYLSVLNPQIILFDFEIQLILPNIFASSSIKSKNFTTALLKGIVTLIPLNKSKSLLKKSSNSSFSIWIFSKEQFEILSFL